jgi:hypothetical protein
MEEAASDKTITGEEFDLDQTFPEDEWEDVIPDEFASQVTRNTVSETITSTSNESDSTIIGSPVGSTVWMYFDKNPSYASGYNVCKKCAKRFRMITSVTTLRSHLKMHQLKAPTRKQTVIIKKKNLFDEEEQSKHDEFLVQWLVGNL